jgi:hypothetical protein
MAKTKISEYDATAGNNTDINSINIDEGCSPSGINNAIRALMSHLKAWQGGTSGDTLPLTSGGTGAVSAAAARTALSAAGTGANSDITSITGLTTPLTVAQGGTGASTSATAAFALKGANADITSITGLTTALTVAQGGTGVTTSTGTGAGVHAVSPTLTTPDLGTPSAVVLTNATGTSSSLNAGIGVGQTWTNVIGSRASGTSYTNSTGKPIMVMAGFPDTGGAGTYTVVVGGVTLVSIQYDSGGGYGSNSTSFIVPNSTTYSITATTISYWTELR